MGHVAQRPVWFDRNLAHLSGGRGLVRADARVKYGRTIVVLPLALALQIAAEAEASDEPEHGRPQSPPRPSAT
jgi:hypothetical protein